MTATRVVLHQFPSSHYNEKARWALDWKGIAHERRDYLPGPHAPQMLRLSKQTATPVLELDGEVIPGSARIIDALERRFPERPLYPADPAERQRALEIQTHFDREFGPAVRTALFSVLLEEPAYVCRLFAGKRSPLVRGLYRGLFPLTRLLMARGNGVTGPDAVAKAFATTERGLDYVAERIGPSGQLAGGAFSVADLTCAAFLALVVDAPHPEMEKPKPIPAGVRGFLARFAAHPAARWALGQYTRHRPRI